jgi:hypothetical protein
VHHSQLWRVVGHDPGREGGAKAAAAGVQFTRRPGHPHPLGARCSPRSHNIQTTGLDAAVQIAQRWAARMMRSLAGP